MSLPNRILAAVAAVAAFAQIEAKPEATSLLGKPLYPPALDSAIRHTYQLRWEVAKRAFDRAPNDADSIIWLARRTAYLGRFREAIAIYTKGIERFPNDARFYRHRGHRYLTTRQIDLAIADLERGARLVRGRPDETEPDGLPNARDIPTSTLQSNLRYHLGLAYYLKGDFHRAGQWFAEDVHQARNDDQIVASTHWLYMSLRRQDRSGAAEQALAAIKPGMNVIENRGYYRLLLLYQGRLPVDSLWPRQAEAGGTNGAEDAAVLYGIGNYFWYNGRRDIGRHTFDRIVARTDWPAFGYLAAEAELARKP